MRGADALMADYAVRYCITRQSYAFADGLEIANTYWRSLADSTQRDVLEALNDPPYPIDMARYPAIAFTASSSR